MSVIATLNYREIDTVKSDIVKVDILINGKVLDALSFVCHRSKVLQYLIDVVYLLNSHFMFCRRQWKDERFV